MLLVVVLVAAAALGWWVARLPVGSSPETNTISEPLRDAERAVLELDLGAGHLQFGAGSGEQMLEGRAQTFQGIETLIRTTTAEDDAMVDRLLSDAPQAVREPERWPEWTLSVNPEVPLELSTTTSGVSAKKVSKLSSDKLLSRTLRELLARTSLSVSKGSSV